MPFPASGGSWCPLACGSITLNVAFFPVSLCLFCPFLGQSLDPTLMQHDLSSIFTLILSVKIFVSNKVLGFWSDVNFGAGRGMLFNPLQWPSGHHSISCGVGMAVELRPRGAGHPGLPAELGPTGAPTHTLTSEWVLLHSAYYPSLRTGSPNPRPWTGTGP